MVLNKRNKRTHRSDPSRHGARASSAHPLPTRALRGSINPRPNTRTMFWPTMVRDVREDVLSCGCRRRKRSNNQQLALLPARAVEPWEILEVDLLRIGTTSLAGNEYILLAVDKASKFPFAFPIPTKRAEGVAQHLLQLCLTFGILCVLRSDGGREFNCDVVKHLCRWLRADIQFSPANHPRG